MKKIFIVFLSFISFSLLGQVSGNINYQTQVRYPEQNINVNRPSLSELTISVKGLANVKADSYVAIFSVTQVGKTTEEVNSLIDQRIGVALAEINKKEGVEVYVDMISFVPVYEIEVTKKVFSKKSFNEIPKGFELKKNIHIKYSNPNLLNDLIAILSNQEVYDLVRVDYFSSNLDDIKRDLMVRAKEILHTKLKNYEAIMDTTFAGTEKGISDGYRVFLPVEMYKSYQAYTSNSLNLEKSAVVNTAEKATTLYYQPIVDKEFDFVINPAILEPAIQVLYEVKLLIVKRNKPQQPSNTGKNEYFIITPGGEIKSLNIGN